jgi:hypothetical protein
MPPASERTTRWSRVAPAAGALFALLQIAALLLFSIDAVRSDTSRADVLATYTDDAAEARKEVGATLVGFGAVCLLFFAARLRDALRIAEGERAVLSSAAFAGGVGMAVLLCASAALETAVSSAAGFFDAFEVDADSALLLASLSVWTLGFALVCGAVLAAATSLAAFKTALLPRWLAIAGFVVAALGVFGETTAVFVVPVMVLLAWVLTVSIVLTAATERTA